MGTKNRYADSLEKLKLSSNYRSFQKDEIEYKTDLSSNDYLGLLNDKGFNDSFYNSLNPNKHKPGSGSSRLLSGNSKEYTDLETLIANKYNREACLIFNSG